jgi:peptide/nickel transport system ATP-binding protein
MIAMALACRPPLLVADEPTTALDVTVQAQILDLLNRLSRDRRMAMMLITHNLSLVHHASDRVLILYAGWIVEEGATERLLSRPRHPYTQALLACRPSLGRRGEPMTTIPGVVPGVREVFAGCPFVTRCPRRQKKCSLQLPPMESVAEGEGVRCFYPL